MTPTDLPVWKRWMIGACVLVFWTAVIGTGAVFALDGIDTIAEQPTKQRCCCD